LWPNFSASGRIFLAELAETFARCFYNFASDLPVISLLSEKSDQETGPLVLSVVVSVARRRFIAILLKFSQIAM
jgi:hypothetical protein